MSEETLGDASAIRIEVAYADEQVQLLRVARVPARATVRQAIDASKILEALPRAFVLTQVGIFSRIVSLDEEVGEGDRVELYRPLKLDPKEARRQRAAARRPQR